MANTLYRAKPFLLSPAEFRFFQALREAIPSRVAIAPKVRLADLVGCQEQWPSVATLGRITQKHVDFVLFDERCTRVLVAIELDDSSHERKTTIERDRFVNDLLNSVRVPLLRVQAAGKYNPMVLRQQLEITLTVVRQGTDVQAPPRCRGQVRGRSSFGSRRSGAGRKGFRDNRPS